LTLVVALGEDANEMVEMAFSKDDQMVQAFVTIGADRGASDRCYAAPA